MDKVLAIFLTLLILGLYLAFLWIIFTNISVAITFGAVIVIGGIISLAIVIYKILTV